MSKEKARYFTFLLYPDSIPNDWIDKLELIGVPIAISPLHDMDEKVFHEVIQIKLNRQDIEYLNKSIRKNIINPDEALNKAIEIILNRHPKLNYRELRHQEWLQNNKIPEKYMSEL